MTPVRPRPVQSVEGAGVGSGRTRALPWWIGVLAIYAVSRALTAVAFLVVARHQAASTMGVAAPDYYTFVATWYDGGWYESISRAGYPSTLPVDGSGAVVENAWAFFPLYPGLVRVLMQLTGGPWNVVAPWTSTVLGALAMLVIHRLIQLGAPRAVASYPQLGLASVALLCCLPTAAVLQTAYTESLALLLIASALLLVVRHRYAWAALTILALGFTRAVALPMVVVLVVHGLWRLRQSRRTGAAIPGRQKGAFVVAVLVTAVSGFAWQWICEWVTGVPGAYLLTQEAWRKGVPVTPFSGWFRSDAHQFDLPVYVAAGVAVTAFVVLMVLPSARRLGAELYTWAVAYPAYLAAVAQLGSSLARFALLAFPLAPVLVGVVPAPPKRARLWLVSLLVLLAGLQVAWLWFVWRFVEGGRFTPSP